MTDYNDGNWHGWNGGECPVHPESIVQCRIQDATHRYNGAEDAAKEWEWAIDNDNRVVAFRVTKPYREPETYTGACFGYHYTSTPPALTSHQVETSILGKYTATHINGKLAKIVWEASE